jgi:hypothetical protein
LLTLKAAIIMSIFQNSEDDIQNNNIAMFSYFEEITYITSV